MQPPSIIFPDVELWATSFLRTSLAARSESYASDVYVSNAVPNPRQNRMVVVRRDGGPRLDQVREAARLSVRVWAKTEQDATDLARLVRALLWASPDGAPVCRVNDLAGPSPVPDDSHQPLRYMTFELIVRATNLAPADASSSSS